MAQPQRKVKQDRPRVKTSLAVDPALWQRVRIQALRERRTAYDVVEQALDLYLTKAAKGGR